MKQIEISWNAHKKRNKFDLSSLEERIEIIVHFWMASQYSQITNSTYDPERAVKEIKKIFQPEVISSGTDSWVSN